MKDKQIILAPAKLNIFLKVLGRRNDGYHIIRSGMVLINLFDIIEIELSNETLITYEGTYKPLNNNYKDCIILRTLDFLDINNKYNFKIKITKNIPVQGGLGSASTNAAAIIQGLSNMHLIKQKQHREYAVLGSDVPFFLFQKNCLSTGIGDILNSQYFPKYFFLVVKPNFECSTKEMYSNLGFQIGSYHENILSTMSGLNDNDSGNDFESIVAKFNIEILELLDTLENLDNSIFARMTGSGSCYYAVFERKEEAINGNNIFKSKYQTLWTSVLENNFNY